MSQRSSLKSKKDGLFHVALQGSLILGDRLVFKKLVLQNPKDTRDYVATSTNIWSYYRFKKIWTIIENRPNWVKFIFS